jgi:hypothetical protein
MTGWEIYGLAAPVGLLALGTIYVLWLVKQPDRHH